MVLDASAAIAHVREETGGARVERIINERDAVLVPWLFWTEVINVLARRHRWPASEVLSAVYDLEQLGMRTEPDSRPLRLANIDAVEAYGLTAYDATYLVLAEAADADLVTGDARLAAAAGDRAIYIGADHGLAEQRAAYGDERPSQDPDWPRWPGAVAYLDELRREIRADVEASPA